MDTYRITLTKGSSRRTIDLPQAEAQIVAQEATCEGWKVASMRLPPGAQRLSEVLEESTDLLMN